MYTGIPKQLPCSPASTRTHAHVHVHMHTHHFAVYRLQWSQAGESSAGGPSLLMEQIVPSNGNSHSSSKQSAAAAASGNVFPTVEVGRCAHRGGGVRGA